MSLEPFTRLRATAAPLRIANLDTDQVIRMERLIENPRGQLGPWCLEALRYRPDGSENPDFVLNRPRHRGARILVAGENFGCGSSREMAVWALMDMGVRCVVAPSFGDIFRGNAFQNGMLPVQLPPEAVTALQDALDRLAEPVIEVDLEARTLRGPDGTVHAFDMEPDRREALLLGLDEIGMTLRMNDAITAFRTADEAARPWVHATRPARLLILPGDGIGTEVMAEVRRVAEWFRDARGLSLDLREEHFGLPAWEAHGTLMRDETWEEILAADAILFGATGMGGPGYEAVPAGAQGVDQLLRMRKELDLFCNFRPVRPIPALHDHSTLRAEVLDDCDMLLVRELAGGIYFGSPRGIETLPDGTRRAVNTCVYTTPEIERIARAAFEAARGRRGRVCSVDKANVLEFGRLWRETVTNLHAREFPDVALEHMFVDNAAMQLVRRPGQFDVIVTENLFGDILSDCAAMVAGSLGMLPSASLSGPDAAGRRRAMYEAIHGSAPDIAGKGIANPCGDILSFALCLRHSLHLPDEALRLEAAVERAVANGARTGDIAGPGGAAIGTRAMGDAILAELSQG